MKSLKTVIGEVVNQLTLDSWNYIPATQWRQNIEVDEKDFNAKHGVVLLDPIISSTVPNMANVDVWVAPITILFMYKQPTGNDASQDQIDTLIEKAKRTAKEFFLRLNMYNDPTILIRNIGVKQMIELDTFLDICLCGVRIQCPITYNDTTSICIPQPPLT